MERKEKYGTYMSNRILLMLSFVRSFVDVVAIVGCFWKKSKRFWQIRYRSSSGSVNPKRHDAYNYYLYRCNARKKISHFPHLPVAPIPDPAPVTMAVLLASPSHVIINCYGSFCCTLQVVLFFPFYHFFLFDCR